MILSCPLFQLPKCTNFYLPCHIIQLIVFLILIRNFLSHISLHLYTRVSSFIKLDNGCLAKSPSSTTWYSTPRVSELSSHRGRIFAQPKISVSSFLFTFILPLLPIFHSQQMHASPGMAVSCSLILLPHFFIFANV